MGASFEILNRRYRFRKSDCNVGECAHDPQCPYFQVCVAYEGWYPASPGSPPVVTR